MDTKALAVEEARQRAEGLRDQAKELLADAHNKLLRLAGEWGSVCVRPVCVSVGGSVWVCCGVRVDVGVDCVCVCWGGCVLFGCVCVCGCVSVGVDGRCVCCMAPIALLITPGRSSFSCPLGGLGSGGCHK